MSTSLLYHAFNLKGITYQSTSLCEDSIIFEGISSINRDKGAPIRIRLRHFFKGRHGVRGMVSHLV